MRRFAITGGVVAAFFSLLVAARGRRNPPRSRRRRSRPTSSSSASRIGNAGLGDGARMPEGIRGGEDVHGVRFGTERRAPERLWLHPRGSGPADEDPRGGHRRPDRSDMTRRSTARVVLVGRELPLRPGVLDPVPDRGSAGRSRLPHPLDTHPETSDLVPQTREAHRPTRKPIASFPVSHARA